MDIDAARLGKKKEEKRERVRDESGLKPVGSLDSDRW
jgi:hypothetical protein